METRVVKLIDGPYHGKQLRISAASRSTLIFSVAGHWPGFYRTIKFGDVGRSWIWQPLTG